MERIITGRIERLHRLDNSTAGNPRFLFVMEDGKGWRTQPNGSIGYEVTQRWEGATVRLFINGRDWVTDADIMEVQA